MLEVTGDLSQSFSTLFVEQSFSELRPHRFIQAGQPMSSRIHLSLPPLNTGVTDVCCPAEFDSGPGDMNCRHFTHGPPSQLLNWFICFVCRYLFYIAGDRAKGSTVVYH